MRNALRSLTRRLLPARANYAAWMLGQHAEYPPDFDADDVSLIEFVAPYTMTSPERVVALADAVRLVVTNDVPGAIVECGVWRGGSMMAVARTLLALERANRHLYLFDTFAGMPEPTARDSGAAAALRRAPKREGENVWCIASLDDVRANMRSTGYPSERVHYVPGRVEDTIPAQAPERIALLRLDTDWYASTRHELEHLYDRLSPGGVLILDDYGHWAGARAAVDEFFSRRTPRPLLARVDYTGRVGVKPHDSTTSARD